MKAFWHNLRGKIEEELNKARRELYLRRKAVIEEIIRENTNRSPRMKNKRAKR